MLTREEHTAKIQEIKTKIHDVDADGSITGILAELSDDYGAILTDVANTNLQNEKLTKDNESLRDTNMRLFLRVGDENKPQADAKSEEQKQELKYENLFDEKGELKI